MAAKSSNEYHAPAQIWQDVLLWSDKRRPFFGLPWSFTRYSLYKDRFLINRGFLTLRQEEVRLYRVLDITVRQTIFQRLFGVGSVILHSTDITVKRIIIQDIKDPLKVARLLSNYAESERMNKGLLSLDCFNLY